MLQYILKLSISLSVVYLFYWLLLRRLTFYTLNRWYLVVYSLFCFVIPCINVFTLFSQPTLQQSVLVSYIPVIKTEEANQTNSPWFKKEPNQKKQTASNKHQSKKEPKRSRKSKEEKESFPPKEYFSSPKYQVNSL